MGKAGLTLSSDPSKFNCPLSRERCRVCLGSLAKRAWHPTLLLQWKSGPPPSPGPALTWPSQQTTLRPTSEKDYQKATQPHTPNLQTSLRPHLLPPSLGLAQEPKISLSIQVLRSLSLCSLFSPLCLQCLPAPSYQQQNIASCSNNYK